MLTAATLSADPTVGGHHTHGRVAAGGEMGRA